MTVENTQIRGQRRWGDCVATNARIVYTMSTNMCKIQNENDWCYVNKKYTWLQRSSWWWICEHHFRDQLNDGYVNKTADIKLMMDMWTPLQRSTWWWICEHHCRDQLDDGYVNTTAEINLMMDMWAPLLRWTQWWISEHHCRDELDDGYVNTSAEINSMMDIMWTLLQRWTWWWICEGTLWSQAHHARSLEDHTRSIQLSTSSHTKHFHNIQQQNNNHTQTYCELFHKQFTKHCMMDMRAPLQRSTWWWICEHQCRDQLDDGYYVNTTSEINLMMDMWRNTGITGTPRMFFGRPYTVYPTEHPLPH